MEFYLNKMDVDLFFKPIRRKEDSIQVLMNAIKIMLLPAIESEGALGKLTLIKDGRMSRLFFLSEKKIFSIFFPFFVNSDDDCLVFSSSQIDSIDHKITSDVISLFSCEEKIDSECFLDFMEPLWEEPINYHRNMWLFVKELLLIEDGYIRFDYDPDNHNGLLHPINHFDIFYSRSQIKIGSHSELDEERFIDILDLASDCHFLAQCDEIKKCAKFLTK